MFVTFDHFEIHSKQYVWLQGGMEPRTSTPSKQIPHWGSGGRASVFEDEEEDFRLRLRDEDDIEKDGSFDLYE